MAGPDRQRVAFAFERPRSTSITFVGTDLKRASSVRARDDHYTIVRETQQSLLVLAKYWHELI